MLDSTLRQKFIYNTPFTDDEMPYVILDNIAKDAIVIKLSYLYVLEKSEFLELSMKLKDAKSNDLLLTNDLAITANNQIILCAIKCYLLSFAYHFQKQGFNVSIQL